MARTQARGTSLAPFEWCNRTALNSGRLLSATIFIVETLNIIFAQIRAALNLDELERHLARIGKAMRRSCRDVGRLILLEDGDLAADGDFRCAPHDHPMLR